METETKDMCQKLLNMRYLQYVQQKYAKEKENPQSSYQLDIYLILQKSQFIIGTQTDKWAIHDIQFQSRVQQAINFVDSLFPCKTNIVIYNLDDLQLNLQNKNITQVFNISIEKFLTLQMEPQDNESKKLIHIVQSTKDKATVINICNSKIQNIEQMSIKTIQKEAESGDVVITSFDEQVCQNMKNVINLNLINVKLQQTTCKTVPQNSNIDAYLNNNCSIIANGLIMTNKKLLLTPNLKCLILGLQECGNLDLVFTSESAFQTIKDTIQSDILTYQFDFQHLNVLQKYLLENNRLFMFQLSTSIIFPNDRQDNKTTERLATPITITKIDTIRKAKLEKQQTSETSPIANDLCFKLLPKQPTKQLTETSGVNTLSDTGFQQLSPASNHLMVSEIQQTPDIDQKFKNLEHNYNKLLNFKQ